MTILGWIVVIHICMSAAAFCYLYKKLKSINAAIAAINEDLVVMDADLEEVFDYLFREGEEIEGNPSSTDALTFESEFVHGPETEGDNASNES